MPPYTETPLLTKDGLKLRLQIWRPTVAAKGVIVHTHGHGEYLGRYGHVAQAFIAAGYVFYTYDLRGHGRSEGPRGHTPNSDAFLDDVQFIQERATAENPGLAVGLYGHSMGGLITLTYGLKRKPQVRGVAVSAPAIQPAYLPPAWKVTLAKTLANIWPTFTQQTGLQDARPMSHDTAFLNSFPDAALAHTYMSARLGLEFMNLGVMLLEQAPQFTLPLFILHGAEDNTIAPAGSQTFCDRAGSQDKTLKLYPGMYHEVHNETGRAEVLQDLVAWFDKRFE